MRHRAEVIILACEVHDFAYADFSVDKIGASTSPSPTLGILPMWSSRRKLEDSTGKRTRRRAFMLMKAEVQSVLSTGNHQGVLTADQFNDRKPMSCRTRMKR